MLPFENQKSIKAPLTKKQIVDSLNCSIAPLNDLRPMPGCLQVSGLEYTIQQDLTVSDVHILNEDGSIKYNLDDFDDNAEFQVVFDDYLASGPIGFNELKKDIVNDPNVESFDIPLSDVLYTYLKNAPELKDYKTPRIKKIN